jgi:hypothetical protein
LVATNNNNINMSTPQPVSEEEFVGRLTDVQKDKYWSVEGEE